MHVCTLCAPSNLSAIATRYLMEGFARGERCVIAGSSRARDAIAEGIGQNRRRACLEIDYAGSMEEQLEIWKLIIADNRGRSLCLIGDAASACAAGMGPDELFEYERRVDPLLRQNKARALCLYDVNAFYGEMLLRALNVHRDCAKYPMPLG